MTKIKNFDLARQIMLRSSLVITRYTSLEASDIEITNHV